MSKEAPKTTLGELAREARENESNARFAFWVALAVVVAGFFDVVSTDLALATGGAMEANPLIRAIQSALGPLWVVPKLALHGALGYMVMWFPNRPTLYAMTGVSGLVFLASASNFSIYLDVIGAI